MADPFLIASMPERPEVIVLGGRRVDAPGAERPRFPPSSAGAVRQRVRQVLAAETARTFVSSAACGADLIGQEAASGLDMRRRVVLPFARGRFRQTSVEDRPGEWVELYDQLLDTLAPGDLIELDLIESDAAYSLTNRAILDDAERIAGDRARVTVIIVWDGEPRGPSDHSEELRALARERSMRTLEIHTTE
jgi:hypothetical protein